jgi:hypothetical protein
VAAVGFGGGTSEERDEDDLGKHVVGVNKILESEKAKLLSQQLFITQDDHETRLNKRV